MKVSDSTKQEIIQAIAIASKIAETMLPERVYQRFEGELSVAGVSEDGITIRAEYNDACNCHPEMQTCEVVVPWSEVEK